MHRSVKLLYKYLLPQDTYVKLSLIDKIVKQKNVVKHG